MSQVRSPIGVALVAALAACSNAGPPPTNVAFDRPGRFVFACFDVTTTPPTAHALQYCNAVDGAYVTGHDLHAIVLQTARGQLGLVDVQPAATSALIDSNPTVPGFTFLSIGEQPVDIAASDGNYVVSSTTGEPILTTYIAHRGSRDLWWIETGQLRRIATSLPWHTVALGAEPTSIALSPDEHYLFVALGDLGVIRQFPIDPATGDLLAPTDVLLSSTVPMPVGADPMTPIPAPWEHVCASVEPPLPAWLAPRMPHASGAAPSPSRLVVQAADPLSSTPGELIVADSSLPVLHVIPIRDDGTGLDGAGMTSVTTGSPTKDLVLTPLVPANTLSAVPNSRYLYGLDDRGDVMVVDWTPVPPGMTSPTHGMVLPVGAPTSRAGDRITFGTLATSLAVLTPTVPVGAPSYTPSCDYVDGMRAALPIGPVIGPTHLRGVFVAVGLADGTVRIVDVWDSDAFCRGAPVTGADAMQCAAAPGSNPTDSTVFIRRHRPRVGGFVTSAASVTAAPTFTVGGITSAVGDDGSAGVGLPSLSPVGPCAAVGVSGVPFATGFPTSTTDSLPPESALVCVGADPWSTLTQFYVATFEGPLVGSSTGRFTVASGIPEFDVAGLDFCAASVVGGVEAAADPSYGLGDQLVITGAPPAMEDPTPCVPYLGTPAVAFEIRHAFSDGRLELGFQLGPDGNPIMDGGVTPEDQVRAAKMCFGQLVAFEVRTRRLWTVRTGASGVLSRIATDSSGKCIVDLTDATRGLESRAQTDVPFVNREVAFTIRNDMGLAIPQGSTLTFSVGGEPGSLAVPAGTLPIAIRYSTVDGKMYVVDPLSQGLTRVALDGYTVDVHYSNQ